MRTSIKERTRSATFGPVVVSLAKHGSYDTHLPGNNFGQAWRAARFYFPLEGELRFSSDRDSGAKSLGRSHLGTIGERSAALMAGWHPVRIACEGADVLEVDIAAERFNSLRPDCPARAKLLSYRFASWAPETCLPSATAAALRELMEQPGSSDPIRAETAKVVQALLASLLTLAPAQSA